jgi:lysozyme
LDFIKQWESLRKKAYLDQAGIPTIGYGTTRLPSGVPVWMGLTCTPEEADEWLAWDCAKAVLAAQKAVTSRSVTQNQFDALVAFIYNIGVGGFGGSTLRRELVAGLPIVEDYFLRWNKVHDPISGKLVVSNGLTNRRRAEWAFFSTP